MKILPLLLCLAAPLAAQTPQITEDEPLVMRLVFDECVGFVVDGTEPFDGLPLFGISPQGASILNDRLPADAARYHIFSTRYVATWGHDDSYPFCLIQSDLESDEPGVLGVAPEDFRLRMHLRAPEYGLDSGSLVNKFTPLVTPYWVSPIGDGTTGVSVVVMPTMGDETLYDAGLISVSRRPVD